ncbi:transporter [Marinobacter alexandrii]|uniref:transporter n=1 Tax=Marinobacter alexandrii TaxID=2570351 RepID=UPI00329919B4
MGTRIPAVFVSMGFIVLPASVFSDDGPISADRPGFSTGTYTVKPGNLNVEFGYQYAFNNHGVDTTTQTAPQLDLRLGLSEKWELDVLWDGWNIGDADDQSSESSFADLSIGGKYRLQEAELYNLTLLGLVSLPVGSSPSTSDNVDPLAGLLWDFSPADQVSVFGVVQSSSYKFENDRVYDAQLAVGASLSHNQSLSTFVEIYGIWPSESKLDEEITLDGGITFLWSKDIQLDINAGIGLNDESDSFVGFGMAARF